MQEERDELPLQEVTYKTINEDVDGALKPVNRRRKIPYYLLLVAATGTFQTIILY